MSFCCSIAIVLAATSIRADSNDGRRVVDLTQVHRIAVIEAPSVHDLESALVRNIPGVQVASEETADLIIEYSETQIPPEGTKPAEIEWVVSLSRLDCQNPEFGKAPGKPSDGPCERRVFVRTNLGSMEGTVTAGDGGVNAFTARLRRAILGLVSEDLGPPRASRTATP